MFALLTHKTARFMKPNCEHIQRLFRIIQEVFRDELSGKSLIFVPSPYDSLWRPLKVARLLRHVPLIDMQTCLRGYENIYWPTLDIRVRAGALPPRNRIIKPWSYYKSYLKYLIRLLRSLFVCTFKLSLRKP